MAYGRLDVYWPSGPVESYQIDKPSTAIGRSSGNDIVLDTNAVSRYHVSLTRKDSQIILVDLGSANGTYLDGERIKAHEPYTLRGGEEIQIGDIRLIFQPEQIEIPEPADITTKPIPPEIQATRRIEIVQPTYKVELDSPDQTVTPGAHIQASLGIQNVGEDTDRYFVEVHGLPKEWVRVDRAELELEPGMRGQVVISFKPLRKSDSRPGDYPIIIRVWSKSRPNQAVEAPMVLRVLAFGGFGMVLGTPRIDTTTPFELHVHNQGSGPLALAISGAAPDGGLTFDIRPPTLTLAAGERRIIRGYVRPTRRHILGQTSERRFDVLVRSQDAAGFLTAAQGTVVDKPMMPIWVATVVVPIVVALILLTAAAVGLLIMSRPRTPVISDFTASASQVLDGDTVELSWTVTDAASLALQVDNGQPVPVDPRLTKLSQVVIGSGQRTFTLIAGNGNLTAQRQVTLLVSTPIKIDSFSVSPNPVLRYVKQDVMIDWKAAGATTVQFKGIEALTGAADTNTYPPTGQLKLTGTPRDTLELTLIATGADGKQITQAVRVDIANPTCTTSASPVEIHSGPGSAYAVSGTIAANSQVFPDGRDQSGEWIHLSPAPNPQAWLSVSGVTCDRFAPEALPLIAVIPPLPTVSSTVPAATPIATPLTPGPATPGSTPTESAIIMAGIDH